MAFRETRAATQEEIDAPSLSSLDRPIPRLPVGDLVAVSEPVYNGVLRPPVADMDCHSATDKSSETKEVETALPQGERFYGLSDSYGDIHAREQLSGSYGTSAARPHTAKHQQLFKQQWRNGVPPQSSQPNYGRLLNFTEEEEEDQQRRAGQRGRSPRTPRTPRRELCAVTPSVQNKRLERLAAPRNRASPAADLERERKGSRPAGEKANQVMSAKQTDNFYNRLSAPKKHHTATDSFGDSRGGTELPQRALSPHYAAHIDRLAQPKYSLSSNNSSSNGQLGSQNQGNPSRPPTAKCSTRLLQLSQPRPQTQAHEDPQALIPKRYYGGTTIVSKPTPEQPLKSRARSVSKPISKRVPPPTWDTLPRRSFSQSISAKRNSVATSEQCVSCKAPVPQQAQRVTCASTDDATTSAVALPHSPVVAESLHVTVVHSTPVKTTNSKPPLVIRARRYVPPDETEAEVTTPATEPAERAISTPTFAAGAVPGRPPLSAQSTGCPTPVRESPTPVHATRRAVTPSPHSSTASHQGAPYFPISTPMATASKRQVANSPDPSQPLVKENNASEPTESGRKVKRIFKAPPKLI